MSYSATGTTDLNNVGNILFLSNNITTLSSNLTIGTSPVANEQYYFNGNANITGNLIGFSNVLIPNGNLGIGTKNPLYRLDVAGGANISSNTILNANANIIGNIGISGNIIGTSNLILLNGNIGIGRINPQYSLDVNGTANISGNINFFGNLNQNGSPYIGSQWTTSESNIYYNTGNVGIGTSNPQYKLDVAGEANISGNVIFNANANIIGNIGINGNILGTSNLILLNGNIGIGRINPQYKLDVNGSANISTNLFVKNNIGIGTINTNANLDISGNSRITGNLNVNNGTLWVDNVSGRVGIKNTNPQKLLDVAGGVNVATNLYVGTSAVINALVPTAVLDVQGNAVINGNLMVNGGTFWVDDINNRVGIRNTNPQYTFDVKGTSNITGNSIFNANANIIGNIGINGNIIGTSNLILLNGNLGIGRIDPQYTLDVNGTANISGNINFFGNLNQNGSPYIGSQWTTNGANIYYNTGNVGIGTSNPQYKLDVAGDSNIGGNVYGNNFYIRNDCILESGDFSILNGNLAVYERFNAFGESYLSGNLTVYNSDIYNYGNIYTYNGLYINKNGALYNLNENPNQHAFYAYDTVNFMTTLFAGADDTNKVGYIGAGGYGGSLPLILNPLGGNIGINIGDPKAKLHVNGNAIITGNLNIDNGLLWTNPVNNRIGINNTNPQYTLDIIGSANLNGSIFIGGTNSLFQLVDETAIRIASGASTMYLQVGANTTTGTSADFFIGNFNNDTASSTRKFMIKADGNVGLGTESPQYLLEVNGSANVNGNLLQNGFTYNNFTINNTTTTIIPPPNIRKFNFIQRQGIITAVSATAYNSMKLTYVVNQSIAVFARISGHLYANATNSAGIVQENRILIDANNTAADTSVSTVSNGTPSVIAKGASITWTSCNMSVDTTTALQALIKFTPVFTGTQSLSSSAITIDWTIIVTSSTSATSQITAIDFYAGV